MALYTSPKIHIKLNTTCRMSGLSENYLRKVLVNCRMVPHQLRRMVPYQLRKVICRVICRIASRVIRRAICRITCKAFAALFARLIFAGLFPRLFAALFPDMFAGWQHGAGCEEPPGCLLSHQVVNMPPVSRFAPVENRMGRQHVGPPGWR